MSFGYLSKLATWRKIFRSAFKARKTSGNLVLRAFASLSRLSRVASGVCCFPNDLWRVFLPLWQKWRQLMSAKRPWAILQAALAGSRGRKVRLFSFF
jgi:hypothetical protein